MHKVESPWIKVGWSTSVLLHGLILAVGGFFVTKQAQPHPFTLANASTEIELVEVPPSRAPQVHPPVSAPSSAPVPAPTIQPMSSPMTVQAPETDKLSASGAVAPQPKKPVATQDIPTAVPSVNPLKTLAAPSGIQASRPVYRQNPAPVYPAASQAARETGVVIVLATISPSGAVLTTNLQQSSHYPRLDRAALEAIVHWKFEPATLAGLPIQSRVAIPVRFELH